MLTPGTPAPAFDCSAIVDHDVVELAWNQVHRRRTLVLQFDSIENYADASDDLVALSDSIEDFERLQANVAVVCRDHVFEIQAWANRPADEGGPGDIAFPIIVDSDDRIASMYHMLTADGCSLWGHIVLDPVGRVRHVSMNSSHVAPNVKDLMSCVAAISKELGQFRNERSRIA